MFRLQLTRRDYLLAFCNHQRHVVFVLSQVDLVPQAGHYPFLDQPEVFLQKLLQQTCRAFPDWPNRAAAQP